MSKTCTEAQFLEDVKDHILRIQQDDGVHRHLVFQKPGTRNQWFELITWDGNLCIGGDMGTYVFQRLHDMFEFFRVDIKNDKLDINPPYYAEKCLAEDRHDKVKKFSREYFRETVMDLFKENFTENPEQAEDCLKELEYDVLDAENEYEAYDKLRTFSYNGFSFGDTWELNFDRFTYHFIWCLYAIVWGIKQYDMAKEKSNDESLEGDGHP